MRKTLAITAFAAVVTVAAPLFTHAQVYVRVRPPAPVFERRGPLPGRGYVWHPGYQRWDGARYAWVPGGYVMPPRPRAVWVGGRWVNTRRGYLWREGYWR